MDLAGAERGRVRLLSQSLTVFRAKLDEQGEPADVEQLNARFKWVPPHVEDLCKAAAEFYLRRLLERAPTPDQIDEEKQLLMISWALRADDGIYKTQVFPFPAIMDGNGLQKKDDLLFGIIREAAVRRQCTQRDLLWEDYRVFKALEFPTVAGDWEALLADAQKKSLATFVSEQGFWPVARLARGLAVAALAQSGSMNGGAGPR